MTGLVPSTRRTRIIGALTLILLAIVALAGWAFWVWFIAGIAPPSVTTDPGQYAKVLKQWSSTGLTAHFPAVLPANVANVRMAAFPGYLQGAAYLQLRMGLPRDQVDAIRSKYEPLATHAAGMPMPPFYTSDTDARFPAPWTLLILKAKDHSAPSWNHGETCGLAVNLAESQVVYWAESW